MFTSLSEFIDNQFYIVKKTNLDDSGWSLSDDISQNLFNKVKSKGIALGEYVKGKMYYGIKTGFNDAFVINDDTRKKLISDDPKSSEIIKPFLMGRDIKRYQQINCNRYLIFTRRGIDMKNYPAIEQYLFQYKESLIPKPKDWTGEKWNGRKPGPYKWYEIQDSIEYYQEFEKPKIMFPDISIRGNFALDDNGSAYCVNTVYIIGSSERYLLGILNSKLMTYFYKGISATYRGGYVRFWTQYLEQLPIYTINSTDLIDKARYDKLDGLVTQMLEIQKLLASAKADHEKNVIQRQIDAIDKQIDSLVYALYGLTEEEIKIIEASVK